MKKEKAMALYAEAINAKNTERFIEVLNFEDGYPNLDEATESHLLFNGTREMVEYYVKSHLVWSVNEGIFKEKWPDIYEAQQKRFAR